MRDPISSGSIETVYYELPDAACLDKSTDLFFSVDPRVQRQAKRICRTCPERERCLEMALTNREVAGVWGGVVFRKGKPDRHDMSYWGKEVVIGATGAEPVDSPPRKKVVKTQFVTAKSVASAKQKKKKKKNGRSHDDGFTRYPIPSPQHPGGSPKPKKQAVGKSTKKDTKKK